MAEAIDSLRQELSTAQKEGEGHEIGIEIVEAEVELLLEVRKEGSGKAGVGFGVVSAGADGKIGARNVHRLTLTLALTRADGGRLAIASESGPRWKDDRDLR